MVVQKSPMIAEMVHRSTRTIGASWKHQAVVGGFKLCETYHPEGW